MPSALPPIPAKRYFTIGEVSELCGVKPYVLRYWEQEFAQLRPMKRRGNRRYYQHHEVLLVRRIRELLYEQGFTISGARSRLLALAAGSKAAGGDVFPASGGSAAMASADDVDDTTFDDDDDDGSAGDAGRLMPVNDATTVDGAGAAAGRPAAAGAEAGAGARRRAKADEGAPAAADVGTPLQPLHDPPARDAAGAPPTTVPAAAAPAPPAQRQPATLALVRRELLLIRDLLDGF